jgi:hypothetical protein
VSARLSKKTFRIIVGGGEWAEERLTNRQAVIRVLIGAGADLLLRRISPQRAGEIQRRVDEILVLFDRVDDSPNLMPVLQNRLDKLEVFMQETRIPRRSGARP